MLVRKITRFNKKENNLNNNNKNIKKIPYTYSVYTKKTITLSCDIITGNSSAYVQKEYPK